MLAAEIMYYLLKSPDFAKSGDFYYFVTGLEGNPTIPNSFALNGNYPNPFNPNTKICFELPEESCVRINIYNTKGQFVKALINKMLPANYHSVVWNGTDEKNTSVASGLYYYKMQAASFTAIGKCMLLK